MAAEQQTVRHGCDHAPGTSVDRVLRRHGAEPAGDALSGVRSGGPTPQDRTILRVKRKRHDPPVDAILFQFHADASTKRRAAHPFPRDVQPAPAQLTQGVFRLAQTLPTASVSEDAAAMRQRIIEAEWDAARRTVAIKRKRGADDDDGKRDKAPPHPVAPAAECEGRKQTPRTPPPSQQLPGMGHFADMLSDYMQLRDNGPPTDAPLPAASDYVYDIYYRESIPEHWRLAQRPTTRAVDARQRAPVPCPVADRAGPPVVGRASSATDPRAFSPVPPPQRTAKPPGATSAPGFEHLANLDSGACGDAWEDDAQFFPLFLQPTMDAEGNMVMVPARVGAAAAGSGEPTEETDPAATADDDEDSNDEDYYGNDYPAHDEWDESGGESGYDEESEWE
ncbi:hypothetical protein MSPP1_001125 [Malassezia sp. CBS 17886]|nr:hypothetical protein MSPP1_001125 [Malassezia sp. CBS 17886]